MRKSKFILLLLLILVTNILSDMYLGKILLTKNFPSTKKGTSNKWIRAKSGYNVFSGDLIRTGPKDYVELLIDNKFIAKLNHNTKCFINKNNSGMIKINLLTGEIWLKTKKLIPGESIMITTPVSMIRIDDTSDSNVTFINSNSKQTSIINVTGQLKVTGFLLGFKPKLRVIDSYETTLIFYESSPTIPEKIKSKDIPEWYRWTDKILREKIKKFDNQILKTFNQIQKFTINYNSFWEKFNNNIKKYLSIKNKSKNIINEYKPILLKTKMLDKLLSDTNMTVEILSDYSDTLGELVAEINLLTEKTDTIIINLNDNISTISKSFKKSAFVYSSFITLLKNLQNIQKQIDFIFVNRNLDYLWKELLEKKYDRYSHKIDLLDERIKKIQKDINSAVINDTILIDPNIYFNPIVGVKTILKSSIRQKKIFQSYKKMIDNSMNKINSLYKNYNITKKRLIFKKYLDLLTAKKEFMDFENKKIMNNIKDINNFKNSFKVRYDEIKGLVKELDFQKADSMYVNLNRDFEIYSNRKITIEKSIKNFYRHLNDLYEYIENSPSIPNDNKTVDSYQKKYDMLNKFSQMVLQSQKQYINSFKNELDSYYSYRQQYINSYSKQVILDLIEQKNLIVTATRDYKKIYDKFNELLTEFDYKYVQNLIVRILAYTKMGNPDSIALIYQKTKTSKGDKISLDEYIDYEKIMYAESYFTDARVRCERILKILEAMRISVFNSSDKRKEIDILYDNFTKLYGSTSYFRNSSKYVRKLLRIDRQYQEYYKTNVIPLNTKIEIAIKKMFEPTVELIDKNHVVKYYNDLNHYIDIINQLHKIYGF